MKWLNVKSPKVRNPRRALLGQTANGWLVGIEIQSRHQVHRGCRIGEYQYATANRYKRMPGTYVDEEKGRAQGRADIVLLMLEQRFGVVSSDLRKRLKAMKPAELTRVGLQITNAGCIEELFAHTG